MHIMGQYATTENVVIESFLLEEQYYNVYSFR